jgi:hypothetical protein
MVAEFDSHWTRWLCEGVMLRVDCYDFYKLSVQIHPLTLLADNVPLADSWVSLYLAKGELGTFFVTFPLKTSRNPANALFAALLALIPDDLTQVSFHDEAGNPVILSYAQVNAIRNSAKEFETVLKAELNGWDAFFVSQKGAFSTTDLITRAETLLPSESARQMLTAEALDDIRQAGRCLAFNLGTAAAFHIVRCTETFIWQYYEIVIGRLPPMKTRNWGAYIRNLTACGNADPKVLGWMTQIKDQYRNPVLHPTESVSPDDALEFINACVSLMMCIAREVEKAALLQATPTP